MELSPPAADEHGGKVAPDLCVPPQGRERARSSLDLAASWPIGNERGDVTYTFAEILSDFAVRRDIEGQGFSAVYENLMEPQAPAVRLRVRF